MPTLDIVNITLPEILLWLLTYAVVYGVLSQVNIPSSKTARNIIAIVSGFLVLMSQPTQILAVLSQIAGNMLLVIIGILIFVIFIEIAGIKFEEGKSVREHPNLSKIFLIILVIIAVAIFISAGGLRLLGWEGRILNIDWNTLLFLLIIIGAIWWMTSEKGG
ncbi:MAG TPA: hypothetical protein EYH56_02615 [Nanoarchaeota archaeon]|nr:hypothetical protein [Nanoarchaeota archaeon]